MNNEGKSTTKNGVEFIEKKDAVINQKPKVAKMPKVKIEKDKFGIRNVIWIIALFIIMFAILIALPYISNYR